MEFSCKWNSVEISMRVGGIGVEHCVLLHKVEKNATAYLDFSCQIKYVLMENKVVSKWVKK